jgi:hypothetical protein
MTEILIRSSFETAVWMRGKGVRFQLGLGRQAFRVATILGYPTDKLTQAV